MRVEPKVFFANERTFLSWLHFTIILGSMATLFANNDSTRVSGYIFTAVALLFALYALWLYLWRAHKIRRKDPGPYDDRIGPVVLVVVFFAAVCLNLSLSLKSTASSAGPSSGGSGSPSPTPSLISLLFNKDDRTHQ